MENRRYHRCYLIEAVIKIATMFVLSSCNSSFDGNEVVLHNDCYIDTCFYFDNPYFYHFAPNSFIRDGQNRKAIASESLEDVELAARLGFKFIEANIWRTSDGHYVCIHGSGGKFGPEVKSVDHSVITTDSLRNTAIGTVSLDWIKTFVRYDSDYVDYQTTIPSLEEFCYACSKNNIGILAGVGGYKEPVEICVKYLADKVIVYGPPADIRDYFSGYVFSWNDRSGTTAKTLLERARYYGEPYLCSIGETVISELTNRNELVPFIEQMHKEHFYVGWASVYSTELRSMTYLSMGMDFSTSGHEVQFFGTNHEHYDLKDTNYLPCTSGCFIDDVIELEQNETVTCGGGQEIFVGKGALVIQFTGTIRISFGSMGNRGDRYELESNGKDYYVFTDYFFHNQTTLTIESLSDYTRILKMEYNTVIC